MAKKTKKEKIMAQYHRKMLAIKIPQYQLPKKTVSANNVVVTTQDDYAYVTKDLGRIFLLTALAICAQFVLWYYLRK